MFPKKDARFSRKIVLHSFNKKRLNNRKYLFEIFKQPGIFYGKPWSWTHTHCHTPQLSQSYFMSSLHPHPSQQEHQDVPSLKYSSSSLEQHWYASYWLLVMDANDESVDFLPILSKIIFYKHESLVLCKRSKASNVLEGSLSQRINFYNSVLQQELGVSSWSLTLGNILIIVWHCRHLVNNHFKTKIIVSLVIYLILLLGLH